MTKVVLTAAARQDLKEIKTYISATLMNPSAANNIAKSITSQLRSLEQFPKMGKLVSLEESPIPYRYLVCGNYMAFYHVQKDSVYVDRILYGRRNHLKLLLGSEWDEETELQ